MELTKMNELPSEKLRRGWTWKTWSGLGATAAVIAALGVTAVVTGPLASAAPEPSPTYVVPHSASCDTYRGGVCYTPEMDAAASQQEQQLAAAQQAAEAAAAKAAAEAAAKAAAQKAAQERAAAGPVKCSAGTRAGAVDDYGNESNCYAENSQGQTCQAYNDANQCTAWGALDVKPLRP
jgi:hypothetical protein